MYNPQSNILSGSIGFILFFNSISQGQLKMNE